MKKFLQNEAEIDDKITKNRFWSARGKFEIGVWSLEIGTWKLENRVQNPENGAVTGSRPGRSRFPRMPVGPVGQYIYRLALTCPLNGQDAKWIRSLRGLDRNGDRIVFLIKQHDQVT